MHSLKPENRIVRFGSFEADLQEGRLSKGGIRIKLQEQPFQILALLLERPGQVVTREEVRQKLWSENTFVEFDDALNTAVRKLRTALGDSAENPRFLETIPRRGYRFVAPVSLPEMPQTVAPGVVQTEPASRPVLSGTSPAEATPAVAGHKHPHARLLWPALAVLLLVGVVAAYLYLRQPAFHITAKDTIIVADFENTTGEAVFDDALRQGLEVGLEQSPLFNILSDRKAAIILKQMGHSPDERMNGRTAIEVCQRTGGKVTVQGSISSLGTTYLIGLAAIRCDTAEPIVHQQVEAKHKEDVIDALGRATTRLRERLGESVPSIQKYNAPLEQATTPSLDALQAYGLALSTWDKKGDQASLPFFKKAIEVDPNFAMAYGALAVIYHNLGETALARENTTKAYQLRDRVTESEKVSIEARYCLYVTGDLEEAARVYERWVQSHPDSAGALNHLGTTYGSLGLSDKALEAFRGALRLDPTRATTYSNLATHLLALNRVDEAGEVLAEAEKRKLQIDYSLQVGYWRAFLRGDSGEMQRLLVQASDVPGAQSLLLSEQANTEAYYGRFERARELSQVAAGQMEHDGDKESAADCLAVAALREAEIQEPAQARKYASQALKMSGGQDVTTLVALTMARIGDLKQAQALSDQLDKEYPSSTFIQKYWLPTIRAEVELRQGRSSKAVETLSAAAALESAYPTALPTRTLYPAYLRGQAYLAAGDGSRAAGEFQKLIDHPGMVLNFPLGALAHLGLGRAYALEPKSSHSADREAARNKARAAYQDFLALWKDADREIPVLKEAKMEYAKLE